MENEKKCLMELTVFEAAEFEKMAVVLDKKLERFPNSTQQRFKTLSFRNWKCLRRFKRLKGNVLLC